MSGGKPSVVTQPKPGNSADSRLPRTVLIISTMVFVLWIGAMIAMYVTTVYPVRHPSTRAAETGLAASAASAGR